MKKHKLRSVHAQGALEGVKQGLGYIFLYVTLIIKFRLHYITVRGTDNHVVPDRQQCYSLLHRLTLMLRTASQ
jgi:hypothetical protein